MQRVEWKSFQEVSFSTYFPSNVLMYVLRVLRARLGNSSVIFTILKILLFVFDLFVVVVVKLYVFIHF